MNLINQKKVFNLIDMVSEEKTTFHKQMANVLRLYYLSLNNVFITEKVLKNVNFSSINLSGEEKEHVENAGWLLDEKYLEDVYLPAIKTNLILDAWLVFRENNPGKGDNFEILINSILEGGKAKQDEIIDLGGEYNIKMEVDKNLSINFDQALMIVKKLIEKNNR